MTTSTPSRATLQDVLSAIDGAHDLTGKRKQDLRSAVRLAAKVLGAEPQFIAADQTTKLVADVEKKIKAIMVAIEDGFYQPEMKGRMDALVAEKARLLERTSSGALVEKVVLHPRMHEFYARKVRELETLFQQGGTVGQAAMETIRSLITRVTIGPINANNGYDAVLNGDLAAILRACDQARGPDLRESQLPGEIPSGSQLSVVAGARFELTTFRL